MKRIILALAILATTTIANAQLSIEAHLASPVAYTDFESVRAGAQIGARISYDVPVTPSVAFGVFAGAHTRTVFLGDYMRNHGLGEVGARVTVGNSLQLFVEGGLSARPFQYQAANVIAGGGIQWKTKRNTTIGASINGTRNIAVPDGLDNAIRGTSDIVVTPRVFVRIPLFKKQRQPKPPVVEAPAPTFSIAETRDKLLADSLFGQAILGAITQIAQRQVEPVQFNQMRQDSVLFEKLKRVQNQVQTLIETQQNAQPQSKIFSRKAYTWHFKTGSSEPTELQLAELKQIHSLISANFKVEVTGSSSRSGSEQLNLKLAQARADCAIESLKKLGVKPERIQARIRPYQSASIADEYVEFVFVY